MPPEEMGRGLSQSSSPVELFRPRRWHGPRSREDVAGTTMKMVAFSIVRRHRLRPIARFQRGDRRSGQLSALRPHLKASSLALPMPTAAPRVFCGNCHNRLAGPHIIYCLRYGARALDRQSRNTRSRLGWRYVMPPSVYDAIPPPSWVRAPNAIISFVIYIRLCANGSVVLTRPKSNRRIVSCSFGLVA